MPTNTETLNRQLYSLLSKYKPKPLDAEGKATPVPDEADIFKFNFTKDGEDYGTVYVTLDEDRVLTVYFGDDVTNSPGDKTPGLDYDDTWSGLLHQLSSFRMTRGLKGFNTKNKDHVNDDMARRNHMRNKDKIAEGYYPMGKKASYSDAVPSVKIVIEHSRVIEEGEQRYRNINRIFLENQLGERYLLDTKKPGIARVYARHIAEGGKVNDDRWSHIGSLCEEYQKMSGFVRATRNGQFNESAQQLVNEGLAHYESLRESLGRLTGKRGYNAYFENWTPSLMEDGTEENNLNELFVQETLDPRIESVMPILNRIHKKVSESVVDKEMNKLAEWADSLVEGEGESIQSNNPIGIPESLDQHSPVTQAITRRILMQHPDLLQKYGPEKVGDAIDDVAEFVGDVEEIGSSDVSGWVKQVAQSLGSHEGVEESALQAYLGDKKYGEKGMDALRKAGREHAGKEKMQNIRAKFSHKEDPVSEAVSSDNPMRPQGKIIKSLRDMAIMSPTLTFQHFTQSGKESVITNAIMAAKQMKSYYQQQGNQGAAQFVYNLENEIDNFRRGYDGNTQDGDTMDLSDLMRGTLSKIQFQTKPGVSEDLDANQKRVGQLGPTEKVGPKGAVGKLVGANENFINTVDQAVTTEDEMDEGTHTQHDRDLNPNDYERPPTDWSTDPIEAGTDRIHQKIASVLKRLSKPEHKTQTDTDESVSGEFAGGTAGALVGGALGAGIGPVGAAVGSAAGSTAGQMAGRELTKEEQLNEFAPLIAAGARLILPALARVGPILGRWAATAGKAGAEVAGKTATGVGRGAADVAKSAAQSAAQNAGKIGVGAGAYQAITDVANSAVGGVGQVYHDVGSATSAIVQAVGNSIDKATIAELAMAAVKYAIPVGILLALLYGGKKLLDQVMSSDAQPAPAGAVREGQEDLDAILRIIRK